MKKIKIIIRGTAGDHEITSPQLEDDDADEQMQAISAAIARGGDISLPWIAMERGNLIAANAFPSPPRVN